MASKYRGYAQRRGFDPIKAPTQIVDRFLEQQANYGNQLRRNQEIKQRQEQQYQQQVRSNNQLEQQNREMVEMSRRRNAALIRDAKLKNLNIEVQNAVRGAETARGYAQALAGFSQSIGKSVEVFQQRRREEQFALGLDLVFQYGISPEEYLELRMGEAQNDATATANDRLVQSMMDRGVPGEVIEQIRNLSGHTQMGAEKALMTRAGENYPTFVAENMEREFPIGQGRSMTLMQAESNLDLGAVRAIRSQLRTEYYKKFGDFDPTMASEYLMEPIRKYHAETMRGLSVAKTKQVYQDVEREQKQLAWQRAETGGTQEFIDGYMAEAAGSDDKRAVKRARAKHTAWLAEGIKNGAIDPELGYQLLDHKITLKGQQAKRWEDLYTQEAILIKDAIRESRKQKLAEYNLGRSERKMSQTAFTDEVRQQLMTGEYTEEDLAPLMEQAVRMGNKELQVFLNGFQQNYTIEARQEKIFESEWSDLYAIGGLTPEMIYNAPVGTGVKQKWLQLVNKQGATARLSGDLKTTASNYVKNKLNDRVKLVDGVSDASFTTAAHHAMMGINRHFTAQVMQGTSPEQALQSALKAFEAEFQDEKGTYRIESKATFDTGSGEVYGTDFKFSNFDLIDENGEVESTIPMLDVGRVLSNDPNALRTKVILNPNQVKGYIEQVKQAGMGVMPPMAYEIARTMGIKPLDVMNLQAQAMGLEIIEPPNYDKNTANQVDPRIQRLMNKAPSLQTLRMAHLSAYGHLPEGGPNVLMTSEQRNALDIIGRYESDTAGSYNAMNEGGADQGRTVVGYSGPSAARIGRNLTDMTVGEVMELQRNGQLHAAGRYQFIGNTLPEVVQKAGVSSDTLFNKETQDLLGLTLLNYGGYSRWVGVVDKATAIELEVMRRAQAQQISLGPSPLRQGANMRFEVIEHVTGHSGHQNYASDHADANYHEHIAFKTRAQRDAAISLLRANGIRLGSIDRPGDTGSYHSKELAIDIPAALNSQPGEEYDFSERIWRILGMMGVRG